MVSPWPAVRSRGFCCCGCCGWARRCFFLADCRHIVIISAQASIFSVPGRSNSRLNTWRVPGGEVRCSCGRDAEDGRSGGDWKICATFWLWFCAESAAPPAVESVIGSSYFHCASGTTTATGTAAGTATTHLKNAAFTSKKRVSFPHVCSFFVALEWSAHR